MTRLRKLLFLLAITALAVGVPTRTLKADPSTGFILCSCQLCSRSDVVCQVSEHLNQIINEVQALTPNIETLKEGMQLQSVGAQQISEALAQLSQLCPFVVSESHGRVLR